MRVSNEQLEELTEKTMVAKQGRVEITTIFLLDLLYDLNEARTAFGVPVDREERVSWHLDQLGQEFRDIQEQKSKP